MNEKYVLWEIEYKLDAYKDQFNKSHPGYLVKNEYEVEVIDERQVKGMFGGETFTGIKAITSDGKEFTRNWNSFPDDSMTPNIFWDNLDICDAIQMLAFHNIFVDENGNQKFPINSSVCPDHNIIYLDTCWKCDYEKTSGRKIK